jgi:hypothetical protein
MKVVVEAADSGTTSDKYRYDLETKSDESTKHYLTQMLHAVN